HLPPSIYSLSLHDALPIFARSRKFMKNYVVLRNLCSNPRTPLDLSLSLMKNLLGPDLKLLSMNKNIPETLRRMESNLRSGPNRLDRKSTRLNSSHRTISYA